MQIGEENLRKRLDAFFKEEVVASALIPESRCQIRRLVIRYK
jgi:hypothetical protein